ncbi:hypothetical protein A2U01_0115387, partial [Trifolium medium]|nr:hypothetical protein [Trifolium medium]
RVNELNEMVLYSIGISCIDTKPSSNQAPQGCENRAGKKQMVDSFDTAATCHANLRIWGDDAS